MWRYILPCVVMPAILGIGTYLTLTVIAPDDHKTKAILMGFVGLSAGAVGGIGLLAAGLANRPQRILRRTTTIRVGPFTVTRDQTGPTTVKRDDKGQPTP